MVRLNKLGKAGEEKIEGSREARIFHILIMLRLSVTVLHTQSDTEEKYWGRSYQFWNQHHTDGLKFMEPLGSSRD